MGKVHGFPTSGSVDRLAQGLDLGRLLYTLTLYLDTLIHSSGLNDQLCS